MSKKKNQGNLAKLPLNSPVKPLLVKSQNAFVKKPGINFFKNCLLLLFSFFFVLIIFNGNDGYKWLWKEFINENLKFINKNSGLTDAQKYQSKFGIDAAAIDMIKSKTPEDAVILFPPGKIIMNDSGTYKFTKGLGGIKSRTWTLYFLYPRKLVYEDEKEKSPFKNKITHIVCINGWGYDILPYVVSTREAFDIVPLKKPQESNAPSPF